MFNNLFTSKSSGCENCGEHSTLSKYGKIKIIKSRVIPDQDIDIERKSGLTFYTTTGEVIKANMTFKMGPWYFYWFEPLSRTNTDHDNVQIAELCSRKCAIQYSNENSMLLNLRIESGGSLHQEPIKPHQEEMDKYRYDRNIKGTTWNISE